MYINITLNKTSILQTLLSFFRGIFNFYIRANNQKWQIQNVGLIYNQHSKSAENVLKVQSNFYNRLPVRRVKTNP